MYLPTQAQAGEMFWNSIDTFSRPIGKTVKPRKVLDANIWALIMYKLINVN